MKVNKQLYPGRVIERLTRFTARVEVAGKEYYLYVPNSGRLKELIFSGAMVYVALSADTNRRTAGEIVFAQAPPEANQRPGAQAENQSGPGLICVNSHWANELYEEAQGWRAVAVFVVQREDAIGFRPFDETDADFGTALRFASSQGVEVYAYVCRVGREEVSIEREIPVFLDGEGI